MTEADSERKSFLPNLCENVAQICELCALFHINEA